MFIIGGIIKILVSCRRLGLWYSVICGWNPVHNILNAIAYITFCLPSSHRRRCRHHRHHHHHHHHQQQQQLLLLLLLLLLLHYHRHPFTSWVLQFLGAFAKLRKATISFGMLSVRPSAWSNSAPAGRSFVKFYVEYFSKVCQETSSFTNIWQE